MCPPPASAPAFWSQFHALSWERRGWRPSSPWARERRHRPWEKTGTPTPASCLGNPVRGALPPGQMQPRNAGWKSAPLSSGALRTIISSASPEAGELAGRQGSQAWHGLAPHTLGAMAGKEVQGGRGVRNRTGSDGSKHAAIRKSPMGKVFVTFVFSRSKPTQGDRTTKLFYLNNKLFKWLKI